MAGTGSSKNVDPIAYRAEEQQNVDSPVTESSQNWQFDAAKLKNADVNLSAYGDDSSETNYNNPNLWGGENDKYKGAETRNTSIAYDKNATLENLNPNYAYGQKAQMVNSSDAGYIQRRNDQIASALYNAGKVSEQDVADFLNQQAGFQNSTENERANTIKSVWKRLGEISSNGNQNENKTDTTNKAENDSAVKNMESDLLQSTAGELYGKNTADWRGEDRAIKTLEDQYSVERAVNEQRIANFKNLQAIDSKDIATSIVSGTTPYGEQGMRDLMQYAPAKYQEVQNYIKQIKGQKNINSITQNGSLDESTSVSNASVETDLETWAKQNTTEATYDTVVSEVKEEMASNQAATTAQQEMNNLSADIAKLQTRLKNIDREAKAAFKSDVPQYLVNAYKANKQLEIQDQISELESRYNTALNLYKTELSNTQWEKEFGLKQQQLAIQQSSEYFDQWYKKQTLNRQELQKDSDGNYFTISYSEDGTISINKIGNTVNGVTNLGGGYVDVPRTGNNVGADTNNFGNFTSDVGNNIGMYKSPNGRSYAVFETAEDGYNALVNDLKAKQSGKSKTGLNANSTIEELMGVWVNGSGKVDSSHPYAQRFYQASGLKPGAKIGSVSADKLAYGIMAGEGTLNAYKNGGVSFGGTTTDIPVPSSIYNLGYMTVDPDSEKGKQLREEYLASVGANMQQEAGIDYNSGPVSSDGVTPISYRQRIYNLIPATLKNSDTELKNVYEVAKTLYENGYSADEAALTFYGLDVKKDPTGLMTSLVTKARGAGTNLPETFYGSLGGLLENGDAAGAITLVENSVYSKDEKDSVNKYTSMLNKLVDLQKSIDDNSDVLGPVSGRVNSKLNKLSANRKYQKAASDMQNAYAALRNELQGSNITESEMKLYDGLFPKDTDTVGAIEEKIKSSQNAVLNDLNAIRQRLQLPLLTLEAVSDVNAKVSLYGGATNQTRADIPAPSNESPFESIRQK